MSFDPTGAEWWSSLCPQDIANRYDVKSDVPTLPHVALQALRPVSGDDYRLLLPQGWTLMKDGTIMAGDAKAGKLASFRYANGQRRYPAFARSGGDVLSCEAGSRIDMEFRRIVAASASPAEQPEQLERHTQYFIDSPAATPTATKVYDLVFFANVDRAMARKISGTFALAPESPDAAITADADARIQSPAKPLLGPEEQRFTVTFSESMNRESVEQAIQYGGILYDQDHRPVLPQKQDVPFQFRWESDTILHVAVPSSVKLTGPHDQPLSYAITVNGAVTKKGGELRDQPMMGAVVQPPVQLWRLAADGGSPQRFTALKVPYFYQSLADPRYVLALRNTYYCECDMTPAYNDDLYDLATNKLYHLPFQVFTTYAGPGDFYADPRGFFYDGDPSELPPGGDPSHIRIDGYVQSAQFSHDGKHVLLAVGRNKDQAGDLDFAVFSLADGELERFPGAMQGEMEQNQVGSGYLPVNFYDDGHEVSFSMWVQFMETANAYRFNWENGDISKRTVSASSDAIDREGFIASADGKYRVYDSHGLYAGEQALLQLDNHYDGRWLGDTHRFAYLNYQHQLVILDADSRTNVLTKDGLPDGIRLVGAAADGRTLVLSAP